MTAARMNAIWIFGDQHRAQALGCNGDPNVSTPEIDRLALDGVNFRRAVSGDPLCCPFRGSLLTSRYPHDCVPGHEYQMPPEMPTIAHAFSEQGYETAYFGKWHVDGFHERDGRAAMHIVPRERRGGFDTWIGYENNNKQWDSWVHGHMKDGSDVEHHRLPGYETDSLTDYLLDFIKAKGVERAEGTTTPFFASLSVQPPHNPYAAPAEYMQRHKARDLVLRENVPDIPRVREHAVPNLCGAYAQIENLDWNVGRVRAALRETGLDENTVIVFFSDHGDMHGSHGQFHKTSPWEESIRIPFIVSGPSAACSHGASFDNPVNHVDIAPTTLGLCGIPIPDGMQGHDYASLCRYDTRPSEHPQSAYLQAVIPTMHGNSIDRPWRGIVTSDGWKYAALEGQPWLMFNLNEDPYELANLAHNSMFDVDRSRLQACLDNWISETGDTFQQTDAG